MSHKFYHLKNRDQNEVAASKIVDGRVLTDRHTDTQTHTHTDRQNQQPDSCPS